MAVEIPEALLWGLRRYLAAPNARVRAIHRQPFRAGLSGSTLEYWRLHLHRAGVQSTITLVYKRGAVVDGAFLRGAPQREALAYVDLPQYIPIAMPTKIAVDIPAGDLWLLSFPPVKNTSHWLADWDRTDIERVLTDLAKLHTAFWDQKDTLDNWSWLAHPTGANAQALTQDGLAGIQTLIQNEGFDTQLTPKRLKRLQELANDPSPLLNPLNEGPITLLHGDAGFQNIALTLDGRQRLWYDWQLTSAGPPALDLVTVLHPWAYPDTNPPLSITAMVEYYLKALANRGYPVGLNVFQQQLDAALIWRWICQWAPLLGQYSQRLQPNVRARLYSAFAELHWPALERI